MKQADGKWYATFAIEDQDYRFRAQKPRGSPLRLTVTSTTPEAVLRGLEALRHSIQAAEADLKKQAE